MCNKMDDFFEFLGFQDAMRKMNENNDIDIMECCEGNIEIYGDFDTKYPFANALDDDEDYI